MKRSAEEFGRLDAEAEQWIRQASRSETYAKNRNWFQREHVVQSSVFAYVDLSVSTDVTHRARFLQDLCRSALGPGNWRPIPLRDLHLTIFTGRVVRGALPEGATRAFVERFEEILADVRPFLAYVFGPHLTPGGVVLECRVYEPTFFAAREAATLKTATDMLGFEYATLGYICGGTSDSLRSLKQQLERASWLNTPVAVPVTDLHIVKTVNKQFAGDDVPIKLTTSASDVWAVPVPASEDGKRMIASAEFGCAPQLV